MQAKLDTSVFISGAGPTGLTLALALTLRGVSVRIIDKALPRPAHESRALGTHARTMDIFERLGVLAPMLQRGRILRGFAFYGAGRRLGRVDLATLDAPYPFALMLPQSLTEGVLIQRLADLGVTVERPTELTDFRQDGRAVTATLRDPLGREETVTAAYLVGCDGAHSAVRKRLGFDFPGVKMQGQYFVDCSIDFSHDLPGDYGYLSLTPETMLVFGQHAGFGEHAEGLWRVVVSLHRDDPRMRQGTPDLALMQALVDEHPWFGARLREVTWGSAFFISSRMAAKLREGRVFLAGDAGHIHSPVGGQGMNTGVADAFNLAWKLAFNLGGLAGDALLDSYQAERYPVARKLLADTERSERLLMLRHPVAAGLRNGVFAVASRLGAVRTYASTWLAGYGVRYDEGHLADEANGLLVGAKTGSLAPDVPIFTSTGERKRLFEVWSSDTRYQLLIFSGTWATPERLASLRQLVSELQTQYGTVLQAHLVVAQPLNPDTSALTDLGGAAHRRYGATAGGLYLVRPDGYIAHCSPSHASAPLQSLLTQLLGAPHGSRDETRQGASAFQATFRR